MNISSLQAHQANGQSRREPGNELIHSGSKLRSEQQSLAQVAEQVVKPVSEVRPERFVQAVGQSASIAYQQRNEVEFELRTRDGDRVRLRLFAEVSGGIAVERSEASAGNVSVSQEAFAAERNSRSQFKFSVEGELDEGELAAINDLLAQVNSVADQFFNGDPLAAYEQLQGVGFDTGEIAGFALELEQKAAVEVRYSESAVQRYRDVAGDKSPAPGVALGRYITELKDAHQKADFLAEPARQLGRLLAEVLRPNLQEPIEGEDDVGPSSKADASALSPLGRIQLMNAELLNYFEQQRVFDGAGAGRADLGGEKDD